ncbi:MAG: hypothetical protein A2402_03570 [Candidatus Staskawiczbacteria bacterium RIFOXYC1_FULL_37_43]|nr:MAG: hypothetical protein A2205_02490 [Candidatus Staskawiczbacteria bacterium RIFOXYA1_FULL_37_15]OGZ77227.1 MAG: hypothetical protein A2280_02315 [Candidatus Staskawiczbacteria bacterium RIFOXYA12_FULL_37_10]OGZ80612.1 MAG: hypothetical protein A2353_00170 [Candidatus Staskawiczbacteria bacterium RIFOXYB1_FULL_38_37]OGZ82400.1 MAG: hypothetical protein A2402_03570 [Candidatus Staskawiczbacteria bacterium RIFOXYC1_FULL_37_43]OGZ83199.1 MAG: hypothetical protein A2325_03045 [Candidatus Stask
MKKVVITSGYFNPLHSGHINLFRGAKKLGDFLIVIVNNDKQVKFKGSAPFMAENERVEIIKELKPVDEVFLSIDNYPEDKVPISESLRKIAKKYADCEIIFAKGGDRNFDNLPEREKAVCKEFNIKVVANVGGDKVQSSSWLLKNVK